MGIGDSNLRNPYSRSDDNDILGIELIHTTRLHTKTKAS